MHEGMYLSEGELSTWCTLSIPYLITIIKFIQVLASHLPFIKHSYICKQRV